MKSTLWSLETRDFVRGGIMAILVPVFVIIQTSLATGSLVFDWKAISIAALSAFLAYISKNFFTDSTGAAVKTLEKQNVSIIEHGKDYRK